MFSNGSTSSSQNTGDEALEKLFAAYFLDSSDVLTKRFSSGRKEKEEPAAHSSRAGTEWETKYQHIFDQFVAGNKVTQQAPSDINQSSRRAPSPIDSVESRVALKDAKIWELKGRISELQMKLSRLGDVPESTQKRLGKAAFFAEQPLPSPEECPSSKLESANTSPPGTSTTSLLARRRQRENHLKSIRKAKKTISFKSDFGYRTPERLPLSAFIPKTCPCGRNRKNTSAKPSKSKQALDAELDEYMAIRKPTPDDSKPLEGEQGEDEVALRNRLDKELEEYMAVRRTFPRVQTGLSTITPITVVLMEDDDVI